MKHFLLYAAAMFCTGLHAAAIELHVSAKGNDAWPGRLAARK